MSSSSSKKGSDTKTKAKKIIPLTPQDTPVKVVVAPNPPTVKDITAVRDEDDLIISLDDMLGIHSPDESDSDEKVVVKSKVVKPTPVRMVTENRRPITPGPHYLHVENHLITKRPLEVDGTKQPENLRPIVP